MARKYKQGQYRPTNPGKYKGDYTNIFYRSSWEASMMHRFDNHSDIIWWSSEEIRIPYISPVDNKKHTYYPDFLIKVKTESGKEEILMIEVKPKDQSSAPVISESKAKSKNKRYIHQVMTWGVNESKWKAAEAFCKSQGWIFKVFTEEDIYGKKDKK